MEEKEFREKFSGHKACYKAWGDYVVNKIKESLIPLLDGEELDHFLKVPPSCRLKDEESLVEKAFYRGKNYANPWDDITDKVGCRFVVLLLSDIELVQKVIESNTEWYFSKDRDFYKEKENEPERFAYQSMHYVVRNRDTVVGVDESGAEILVPINTPCEIQIRTLMQHAYSEMTHDSIYKSDVKTQNDVVRIASRCSAMIETTDELFESVSKQVKSLQKLYEDVDSACRDFIKNSGKSYFPLEVEEPLVKAMFPLWSNPLLEKFKQFLAENASGYLNNEPHLANVANLQILFLAIENENGLKQCVQDGSIDFSYLEDAFVCLGKDIS